MIELTPKVKMEYEVVTLCGDYNSITQPGHIEVDENGNPVNQYAFYREGRFYKCSWDLLESLNKKGLVYCSDSVAGLLTNQTFDGYMFVKEVDSSIEILKKCKEGRVFEYRYGTNGRRYGDKVEIFEKDDRADSHIGQQEQSANKGLRRWIGTHLQKGQSANQDAANPFAYNFEKDCKSEVYAATTVGALIDSGNLSSNGKILKTTESGLKQVAWFEDFNGPSKQASSPQIITYV